MHFALVDPQKIGKSMIPMFFSLFSASDVWVQAFTLKFGDKGWGSMFPSRKWGMSDFPILGIFPLEDTYINLGHLLTSWLSNPKILLFSKTFRMQVVGDVYVAEPDDFTLKHPWYQGFTSFHKRFPSIPWWCWHLVVFPWVSRKLHRSRCRHVVSTPVSS